MIPMSGIYDPIPDHARQLWERDISDKRYRDIHESTDTGIGILSFPPQETGMGLGGW